MDDAITQMQLHQMELTKTIEELNDVVTEQAKTIHRLEARVKVLEGALSSLDPAVTGGVAIGDTPPPHY